MKDKVPNSAKVEFALAMNHFRAILNLHQITLDNIKEMKDVKKVIEERNEKEGDEGSNEVKQE